MKASSTRLRARGVKALVAVLVVAAGVGVAPAQAAAPYQNTVFRNWSTTSLDVLVLIDEVSPIGQSFQRSFDAWEAGIAYWASDLAEDLDLNYRWATTTTVPLGFRPDILVVPQGFMAITMGAACVATAPMVVGYGSFDRVTYHEFGHCLGLGHVWHNGVEYSPGQDIMGGGDGHKCPSNLNVATLRNVFSGSRATVSMAPSAYKQAPSC